MPMQFSKLCVCNRIGLGCCSGRKVDRQSLLNAVRQADGVDPYFNQLRIADAEIFRPPATYAPGSTRNLTPGWTRGLSGA